MVKKSDIKAIKDDTSFTKDDETRAVEATLLIAELLLEIRDILDKGQDEAIARDKRRLELTEIRMEHEEVAFKIFMNRQIQGVQDGN